MAKKRTYKRGKTTAKRKTGKVGGKTDWTWRILCILFVVSLIAVILYYVCPKQVRTITDKVLTEIENIAGHKKAQNRSGKDIHFSVPVYTDLEIPVWKTSETGQIIRHIGYTVSFNKRLHIPNWVAYELTKAETVGTEKRTNDFTDDPYANGVCATDRDYKGSGYDKGHMAPAGDMKWSREAMKESFYFTNICPQKPELNRGVWKDLEEEIRVWARRDSALVIVCGPITAAKCHKLGNTGVAVPKTFFKVVVAPYIPSPRAIGFVFSSAKGDKNLEYCSVSVDSVERLTGMDFFSALPDDIESLIEKSSNYKEWQ